MIDAYIKLKKRCHRVTGVTPIFSCHLFAQQLYNFSEKLYNCFLKLEEESGFSQVFEDECYLTGREDALGTSVPRLRQGLR